MNIAQIWGHIQARLFPHLEECLAVELTAKQRRVVAILEIVRIEEHVPLPPRRPRGGRPPHDRRCLARAFVIKAAYNLPQTNMLIDWLRSDATLRAICGYQDACAVPSESVFSRAFAEFAADALGNAVHEAMVKSYVSAHLVGHISRDATAIEAREKPLKKPAKPAKPKRRRGRPRKGEVVDKSDQSASRLPKQLHQDPQEALSELPVACDVGTKRNAKGHTTSWIGYKAHIDANDAGLPITVVTTSASLHDSQVAIPMEKLTGQRVTSLYALMDSAYDAKLIRQCCYALGHVPIIDHNARGGPQREWDPATARRYDERTSVERVNSRLKDQFGGRHVRVRGHDKVHLHIMFGIVALFADQLLQLVT